MNTYAKEYIDKVCARIRWKGLRSRIREELSSHISDLTESLAAGGYPVEEAIQKAVQEMGDAEQVAKSYNQMYAPKKDLLFYVFALLLLAMGLTLQTMIYFSGDSASNRWIAFVVTAVLGTVLFTYMERFDYALFYKRSEIVYLATLLLVVCVRLFPRVINGSSVYLYYVSLLVPMVFCVIVYKQRLSGYTGLLRCICLLLVTNLLFLPSMATLVIFSVSSGAVLIAALYKDWFSVHKVLKLPLIITMAAFILGVCLFAIYRSSFMVNAGLQNVLANCGIFTGAQSFDESESNILPYAAGKWHTQYALAYLAVKYGIVYGFLPVIVFLSLLFRMVTMVRRTKSAFGFAVTLSSALVLTVQFLLFLLGSIWSMNGFAVALPFVSYGPVGYICNAILLGLFSSAFRHGCSVTVLPSRTA